jgi:hypothetical protein
MEKAIIIFHTHALIEFDKCGIDVDNGKMNIFILTFCGNFIGKMPIIKIQNMSNNS